MAILHHRGSVKPVNDFTRSARLLAPMHFGQLAPLDARISGGNRGIRGVHSPMDRDLLSKVHTVKLACGVAVSGAVLRREHLRQLLAAAAQERERLLGRAMRVRERLHGGR